MTPFAQAILNTLQKLTDMAVETLDGIPDEDLNGWKPDGVVGEVNTLFGLATHIAGSGEYWVLEAAGGIDQQRDRPAEFVAKGNLSDIRNRYDEWLDASQTVLAGLDDEDLTRVFTRPAGPSGGSRPMSMTVAECLTHTVGHTAIHVGHLDVQRQLWDHERATD